MDGFSFFSLLPVLVYVSVGQVVFQFLFVITTQCATATSQSTECFSFFSLLLSKKIIASCLDSVLVSFRYYKWEVLPYTALPMFQFLFVITVYKRDRSPGHSCFSFFSLLRCLNSQNKASSKFQFLFVITGRFSP